MKTLTFNNGDQMPILGLGTWKSAPGDVYGAVKEAIALSYRHVDCAFIYRNEAEIGRALSECFEEGIVSRDQMWITSKLWNNSHAPEDVEPTLRKTLADLQLDYLDLYLIHWPVALKKGVLLPQSAGDLVSLDAVPIADTWEAMAALVERGLCRHVGVSNFSIAKLGALVEGAKLKPEMNQIELHPYLQQSEMLEFCRQNGVHLTAYSPLGSKDRPPTLKAEDEPILLEDPTITAIAREHGATPAQILLTWAINRGTAAIPKSVNSVRMAENLVAAEVSLTAEDVRNIGKLDIGRRYVSGEFWTGEGSPYTLANLWDD